MPNNMPKSLKSIMAWVLGIGIIAFILLILVIIFGNLQGNLGFSQNSTSVTNESITTFSDGGNTVAAGALAVNPVLTGVILINSSSNATITSDNYTISGAIIYANETSTYNGTDKVKVTYTLSQDTKIMRQSDSVIINYTSSATNTSSQFPTIGTIMGIAILLFILIALLVFVIVKMMGVSSSGGSRTEGLGGGSLGGGGRKFEGSSRGFS